MAIKFDSKSKTYYVDTKIKREDGTYYHFTHKETKNPDFKSKRYVQGLERGIIEKKKREMYSGAFDIQTLEDLFDRYYRSVEEEFAYTSLKRIDSLFNYNIKDFFDNRLSFFFSVKKLEEFRNHVSKLTIQTVSKNKALLLARKLIIYARKIKLIDSDTKDDCLFNLESLKNKVSSSETRNGYTSIEELGKILNEIESENDRDILRLLYFSGLRIGEFLGIKISDIEFSGDVAIVSIKRQMLDGMIITETLKTKASYKKIAYVGENLTCLWNYIQRNDLKENDFLTTDYNRKKLYSRLNEACDKAGVKRNTLHGFGRKSINTELYKLGADSKVRTMLLGQSSVAVNEKSYIDNEETFNIGLTYLNKVS